MDKHTKDVFYDKLTYVYLEMPKFRKTEAELDTLFDKWLYAIKNMATLIERPAALQEAIFQRLFEQAEIAKFNKNELYDYRESQKEYWDWNAVTETAERKGIVKGIAKGRAEGLAEGLAEGEKKGRAEGMKEATIANALNLKKNGVPIEIIANSLGLNIEEVQEL